MRLYIFMQTQSNTCHIFTAEWLLRRQYVLLLRKQIGYSRLLLIKVPAVLVKVSPTHMPYTGQAVLLNIIIINITFSILRSYHECGCALILRKMAI
jgi:hypothetical protein